MVCPESLRVRSEGVGRECLDGRGGSRSVVPPGGAGSRRGRRAGPIRDEVPVAYVVRAPGARPVSAEELATYAAERLAPAKRPRAYHFVLELPRTSVGKIRKFLLTDGEAAAGG
jgi:acyl-CoA synthetase (AMP-forming)/AMP-acid ligase II